MNTRPCLNQVAVAVAVGLASVLLADSSRAQTPGDTAAAAPAAVAATILRGGEMGELLSVYVPRGETEVQRLLDDARDMERSASGEIDGARRLAMEADGRVKIMKEELETTKVRRKVAKQAKDQAGSADLDAAMKRQAKERSYLERLRDAMRADADRLEAERTASAARVKALELELEVARKYPEVNGPGATSRSVDEYRTLLRRMLDAQRQSADRWRDASDKRKRVADRRIKQLHSLSKLSK